MFSVGHHFARLHAKRALLVVFGLAAGIVLTEGLARYVAPKDSVFWDHPMMMPYSGGAFEPSVTYERVHENGSPDRRQRYVQDYRRWYKLDPEQTIPVTGKVVLNLGDSSTWGWGLADRRFAYASILNSTLPIGVTSINLGVPYYSSLEGLMYLRELVPIYADRIAAVTLYFGNNDATENGQPDQETLNRVGHASALERQLAEHSAIYRLFRKAEFALLTDRHSRTVRVRPDEYEANLRAMIQLCELHKIPVVIIEPRIPLSWQPAHISRAVSVESKVRNAWSASELKQANALYALGSERVLQRNDSYKQILEQAVEHDWVIPRIKSAWRARLSKLEHMPLVTVVRLPEPFIEAEYPWAFEDYCHPSANLHAEIARRISKALAWASDVR